MWKPSAPRAAEVVAAWSVTPVPFSTDTVILPGAGRGAPVMEFVLEVMPRNESTTDWSSG